MLEVCSWITCGPKNGFLEDALEDKDKMLEDYELLLSIQQVMTLKENFSPNKEKLGKILLARNGCRISTWFKS